jgi:hypothetical protein
MSLSVCSVMMMAEDDVMFVQQQLQQQLQEEELNGQDLKRRRLNGPECDSGATVSAVVTPWPLSVVGRAAYPYPVPCTPSLPVSAPYSIRRQSPLFDERTLDVLAGEFVVSVDGEDSNEGHEDLSINGNTENHNCNYDEVHADNGTAAHFSAATSSSSSASAKVSSATSMSSVASSLSSTPEAVAVAAVKKRIYHRRANPFPRVLKRDIRRDYGAMLINVLNSFDGDLTAKFFTQFCIQDCHKLDIFPEVTKDYNLPGFRRVDGLNQIVYHLLHDLSHIPDSVFCMKGSHIRQRSDITGSQVCVRVLFQGTKTYMNQNCDAQVSDTADDDAVD